MPLKTILILLNQYMCTQQAAFLIKYPWHTSEGMMCIQLRPTNACGLKQDFGPAFVDPSPHSREQHINHSKQQTPSEIRISVALAIIRSYFLLLKDCASRQQQSEGSFHVILLLFWSYILPGLVCEILLINEYWQYVMKPFVSHQHIRHRSFYPDTWQEICVRG